MRYILRGSVFCAIINCIFFLGIHAQPFCPPPGGNSCTLLPDILAGKKTLNSTSGWTEYSQLITGINKGLIRIDVSTPNVGWGPLEIQSTNNYLCGDDTLFNFFPPSNFLCPDGSYPRRLIKQNIFNRVNGVTHVTQRDAGWMTYHPAHGHIHIDGWGSYSIRLKDVSVADTLQWPVVSKGIKVSFCLIDLTTCSGSLGDCVDANGNVLTNASFPNYGLAGPYNSCGDVKQGISVGKVDVYSQSLDESFVKIPYEACNGNYFVMVEIDPDDHFQEMNENNNWLAAQVPFTKQRTANTGPYAYIFSEQGNNFCTGGSMILKASGANSYLWSTGATSQNIIVNDGGKYWVRATTPCGTTTSDTLTLTRFNGTTEPATTLQDTVCAGQTATLFGSGNAKWYDAPTGGNLVYSGNNFQTGALTNNVTYYVEDEPMIVNAPMGPPGPGFSPSGLYNVPSREYLVFNAFIPFKLKKVTVNAELTGTRIIQLRNLYNKVIAQKSVNLTTTGVQEIDLDFDVPVGLNHQLGLSASTPVVSLFMNTTTNPNIGFPFKLNAVANIVGSSLGDVAYPFFYNWKIETSLPQCVVRQRKPVTAVVKPAPVVQLNGLQPTYLHTDPPVQISGTPPGGVLTGSALTGNTFNPRLSGVGTYIFRYDYSDPYCPAFDTKIVVVNFNEDRMQDGFDVRLFNTPGDKPVLQLTSRENSAVTLRLINSVGQVMRQWTVQAGAGTNMYNLDLERYAKAVYSLNVIHNASGKQKVLMLAN